MKLSSLNPKSWPAWLVLAINACMVGGTGILNYLLSNQGVSSSTHATLVSIMTVWLFLVNTWKGANGGDSSKKEGGDSSANGDANKGVPPVMSVFILFFVPCLALSGVSVTMSGCKDPQTAENFVLDLEQKACVFVADEAGAANGAEYEKLCPILGTVTGGVWNAIQNALKSKASDAGKADPAKVTEFKAKLEVLRKDGGQ